MSSEDEYYNGRYEYRYDRQSSKKARRRGTSPRRRQFDSDYFYRKGRRSKHRSNNHAPRIAALIILLVLIAYEVFILSSSSSSTEKKSAGHRSTEKDSATIPIPVNWHAASGPSQSGSQPVTAKTNAKPISGASSDVLSKTDASSSVSTSISGQLNKLPAQEGSSRRNHQTTVARVDIGSVPQYSTKASNEANRNEKDSLSKTSSRHLPESAIKLETKGADTDPDIDSRSVRRRRSSHPRMGPQRPPADGHSKSETASTGDKGAEPGAGENFWNWFQETKGSDKKGVSKSLPCPEDYRRLCEMFYKYIRKYKIRRIFDVSCEKNYEWMGNILKKAGNELWGFKYYCSIWNGEKARDARIKLGGLPFVEFDDAKWWRAGFAPDTELLFAWDTLAHLAYGRVWNFFVKARKQEIKYILVDNYPGILNDPSPKRDYLNLRKHPFRFPSAKEVAQNVTEPGETSKRQLLFYETNMLPENLQ